MKILRIALCLMCCIVVLSGCHKKKTDNIYEYPDDDPSTPSEDSTEGDNKAGAVVEEEVVKKIYAKKGGRLTNSDGSISIEIPADALEENTTITMTVYDAEGYPASEDEDIVSKIVEFEPSGTIFKKPFIISMETVKVVENKIVTAAVFKEDEVRWSYDEHGVYAVLAGKTAAGDPIMTSAAGDPIMLNAAGDPIMTSAAGDPIMMAAAGDPIMLASAGDPIMTNAAGDPIMNAAAGDPIMMTTGHFTAFTFIALVPKDSGDGGDEEVVEFEEVSSSVICTGQDKCYDNGAEIACQAEDGEFFGQDAQYADLGKCIPHSFTVETVSDESVVVDNNTNLQWQQAFPEKAFTWNDAVSYCENLTYAGYSDWRLPGPAEIYTISDLSLFGPAFDTTYFPNIAHSAFSAFWTSQERKVDPLKAYFVYHYDSYSDYKAKTATYNAICVRGDKLDAAVFRTSAVEFDRVVTDMTNGLYWQRSYETNKTWQEALSYCENLTYAGFSDWRLPDRNELTTLFNYDKTEGAFSDFPAMPDDDYFWSSSTVSFEAGLAWLAHFGYGYTYYSEKVSGHLVRCVRSENGEAGSRRKACTGLPENAEWNTVSKITQTLEGGEWLPSAAGVYSEEASTTECRFKCVEGYEWNGEACVELTGPCHPNPCREIANSTKECIETDETTYTCGCKNGSEWDGSDCVADVMNIPECAPANATPCNDSATSIMWSSRSAGEMNWENAGSYCENLTEAGYSDWRLPNISELRTLVQNCAGTATGGFCGVVDTGDASTSCLSSDCFSIADCDPCVSDSTGGHSKLGDIETFWSSSVYTSDTTYAWRIYFESAYIGSNIKSYNHHVRCIRAAQESSGERPADCTGLPANAEWNTVSTITQTWNGSEWLPSATGVYSETASSAECRFKCVSGYEWNGTQCVSNSSPSLPECSSTSGSPCIDSETTLTWSAKTSGTKTFSSAVSYCENLTEGGYDDWRMPDIDELLTLLTNADRVKNNCQISETGGCLLYNGCWTCSTCTLGTQSSGDIGCSSYGTSYSDGRYSLIGDTDWLWSSSYTEDTDGGWGVDFSYGNVGSHARTESYKIRCVRGEQQNNAISFPYTDPDTNLTWSAESSGNMVWDDANSYCENLTEGGYDDWRVPNIDELRTLMINADRVKNNCQVSEAGNCLSYESCWTCSTCTLGTQTSGDIGCSSYGTTYSDGRYSKLGDTNYLWSSSTRSDNTDNAWHVGFGRGSVGNSNKTSTSSYVRCVRSGDEPEPDPCNPNPCTGVANSTGVCTGEDGGYSCGCNVNYTWNPASGMCVADERNSACTGLPENAQWNTASTITQTWNGSEWLPSATGVYSETASTTECRFKCVSGYEWNGTQCAASSSGASMSLGNICTNQTTCYDTSSSMTCPTSSSAYFYGQDAQYTNKCTAQSFSSTTNVVIDNNTGLTWEKSPSSDTYTWANANNHCADLNTSNYGGKNNWRVPNPLELLTIVDNSRYNPATNSNFTNMPTDDSVWIWTSKEYKGDTNDAYYFSASYGYCFNSGTKTNTRKVLCVSGNEMQSATSSNFTTQTITGSVVVTDSATGLMWQKEYETSKTWEAALSYCENLTYAGYSDWRLPNKNELASLVNYEKSGSPYSYFPDMPSSYFRSSSTFSGSTDYAWSVNFNYGSVTHFDKANNGNNVRCVRSGEESPTDPCNPNPCADIANSTGVCAGEEGGYSCGCNENYEWNGTSCVLSFPYTDPDTNLTWSAISSDTMVWNDANSYCENLTEGGFTDWRLPNIDELRTLIQECAATEPGGTCGVTTSCLSSSCQDDSCYSCSSDSTGGHSKLGDTNYLWSSSVLSDISNNLWYVNFFNGKVNNLYVENVNYVRCVR